MQANEFVKKFGWDYTVNYADYAVNVSDLKRLVESWELVMEHGGIERARKYAESKYTAPEIKLATQKAITDVESTL